MSKRKATETDRCYVMAGRNAHKVADMKMRVRELENFEMYAVKKIGKQEKAITELESTVTFMEKMFHTCIIQCERCRNV